MNNASSLAFSLLVTIACLLPASAVAQTNVYYHQPLNSLPFVSQVGSPADGAPLTFTQANMYHLPMDISQSSVYSQSLSFSQANVYSLRPAYFQPLTYSQPYTASQGNIAYFEGQSIGTYSSIPAAPVEVVASELPVFSAPSGSQPAVPTHTAACST